MMTLAYDLFIGQSEQDVLWLKVCVNDVAHLVKVVKCYQCLTGYLAA